MVHNHWLWKKEQWVAIGLDMISHHLFLFPKQGDDEFYHLLRRKLWTAMKCSIYYNNWLWKQKQLVSEQHRLATLSAIYFCILYFHLYLNLIFVTIFSKAKAINKRAASPDYFERLGTLHSLSKAQKYMHCGQNHLLIFSEPLEQISNIIFYNIIL